MNTYVKTISNFINESEDLDRLSDLGLADELTVLIHQLESLSELASHNDPIRAFIFANESTEVGKGIIKMGPIGSMGLVIMIRNYLMHEFARCSPSKKFTYANVYHITDHAERLAILHDKFKNDVNSISIVAGENSPTVYFDDRRRIRMKVSLKMANSTFNSMGKNEGDSTLEWMTSLIPYEGLDLFRMTNDDRYKAILLELFSLVLRELKIRAELAQ